MNSIVLPKETGQDYMWVAEYYSGIYSEYDIETLESNSFYDINKEKLVRFGLVGRNKKMWFECSRGTFNFMGKRIDVRYRTEEKTYELTNHSPQRDVITYKKAYAEADASGRSGVMKNRIVGYSYGYKAEMEIEGVSFNFKPIINVPHGQDGNYQLSVTLVSDQDIDGKLEFLIGDEVMASFEAPLIKNVSGQLNWSIV